MTVKDLIDTLKNLPEDMEIVVGSVFSNDYEYAEYIEIVKDPTCGRNYYSEEERIEMLNKGKQNVVVIK